MFVLHRWRFQHCFIIGYSGITVSKNFHYQREVNRSEEIFIISLTQSLFCAARFKQIRWTVFREQKDYECNAIKIDIIPKVEPSKIIYTNFNGQNIAWFQRTYAWDNHWKLQEKQFCTINRSS